MSAKLSDRDKRLALHLCGDELDRYKQGVELPHRSNFWSDMLDSEEQEPAYGNPVRQARKPNAEMRLHKEYVTNANLEHDYRIMRALAIAGWSVAIGCLVYITRAL